MRYTTCAQITTNATQDEASSLTQTNGNRMTSILMKIPKMICGFAYKTQIRLK